MMRLKEQDLASVALRALPATVTRALRTRYRTLRIMCHTSGLAATYAFAASKAANTGSAEASAYRQVHEQISARLRDTRAINQASTDIEAVLEELTSMDAPAYLRATEDIALLLEWLARLADATVVKEPTTHKPDTAT